MKNIVGNLHDIDLRLLRVFQTVVRHGGFSAAQDVLGLTPSTISNHMTALEERLGVKLCLRGRGGFRLTERGRKIHEAMLDLFGSIETFRSAVGAAKGTISGVVEFGTVDALSTNEDFSLSDVIGEFAKTAPNARLNIQIASPQELLRGLIMGRFHVILTPFQKFPKTTDAQFVFRELQQLYCGRNHPLYDLDDTLTTLDMVSRYAYVARSYDQRVQISGQLLNLQATISFMESAAIMISSGQFIGYLPDHFARSNVISGKLRAINCKDAKYFDDFYIVSRRSGQNAAAEHISNLVQSLASVDL
ncbi:MAG: LysR family transcriptional regulator [Rhodobacteraceae bacterium]|nr:LysR family transcriptional regulator [Paracoccaceae bacterium]